jgi:hypothetical protein
MRRPPRIYSRDEVMSDEFKQRVEALNLRINQDYWDLRDRRVDVLAAVTVIACRYDLKPERTASILGLAPNFIEKHFSFGGQSA